MTFVAQQLTQELATQYTANIRSEVYSLQETFVIDKDRNVLLLSLGGQGHQPKVRGEPPDYYAMFWNGMEIDLQVWFSYAADNAMCIEVASMAMPTALTVPMAEIEQTIVDALQTYWEDLGGRPVKVRATFGGVARY